MVIGGGRGLAIGGEKKTFCCHACVRLERFETNLIDGVDCNRQITKKLILSVYCSMKEIIIQHHNNQ